MSLKMPESQCWSLSRGSGLASRLAAFTGSTCADISIVLALGEDELSESLAVQLHALELEHDWLTDNSLLLRVAYRREKRVFQTLLQRDAEVRVEDQDLLQEIDSLGRRAWVFLLEVGAGVRRELLEVLKRFQVRDEAFIGFRGSANDLENDRQLVVRREGEALPLFGRILCR